MKTHRVAQWFKRLMAAGAAVLLALALVPAAAAQDGAASGKFSSELLDKLMKAGPDDLVPVIVQTYGEPSAAHMTRLHGRGGYVKNRHSAIRGYSGRVPAGQLQALAADPEIERLSFDSEVKAHLDVATRAIRAAQALQSFPGNDGRGVGVAVVDTGAYMHDDIQRSTDTSKLVRVEMVAGTNSVNDQYGHGTHVAGIIAGTGLLSSDPISRRTFRGVAPGARIISIRALYADGSGYSSDIINSIEWAILNKDFYNIRVLNLSLGHPVFESYWTDPLCRAVRAAYNAGIVVVVSAGNDGARGSGFGTITSPANDPTVITVGAMDDLNTPDTADDVLAWYSSKGPSLVDFVAKPDLVAPGSWVVSLRNPGSYLDTNYHELTLKIGDYKVGSQQEQDGAYYSLSGTSMAAPMVSAAAALMIQKDPGLNPATVKARLMASARKDGRLIFETGAGYLDVDAALKASGYASDALSPTCVLGEDGNVYLTSTGLIWGFFGGFWDLGLVWGGGNWSLSLIWGFDRGYLSGWLLSTTTEEFVTTNGAIWKGNKAHSASALDNNTVTADSIIWGGMGSWLLNSTGTVDILAAVWGGGGGGGGGGGCRKC